MGLAPIHNNLRGFREFCDGVGGFGMEPSLASSLVLDEEMRELKGGQILDAKAAATLKSHCEAERRRRERIHGHFTTLRSMVPCSDKLDKAALHAEVIAYVKKLKNNAMEVSKGFSIPSDADEVKVLVEGDGLKNGSFSIKASLCCEDRPDLLADLQQTLQSLQLKIVRAEMCTLGGRMKNVIVMSYKGIPNDAELHLITSNVQQALRSVHERATLQGFVPRSSFTNKRRRTLPFESSCLSS